MARSIGWLVLLMAIVGCAGSSQRTGGVVVELDFERDQLGRSPAGFVSEVTGGPAGSWVVREDATAPAGSKVLVQESTDSRRGRFPVCVYGGLCPRDVEVTIAFKPISGKVDQGAGIVVRYQDANNYYIARANALEDNVRLYRVVGGRRTQFAGVDVGAPSAGQWHTLSLKVVGDRFEVGMDGRKLFDAQDDTFRQAGRVGLWTKADSVTQFDRLVVRVLDR